MKTCGPRRTGLWPRLFAGAVRSPDLVQWEDISKRVSFPAGARHGTVLAVPESAVRRLEASPPRP